MNNTKRLIISIVIAFAVCNTTNCQTLEGWKEIQTGISEDFLGVCCIDTSMVFVCGTNGNILMTIDGGNSWETVYEKEGFSMWHIAFVDGNVGYAYGDSCMYCEHPRNVLVKTTDGGLTWNELPDMGIVPFSGSNASLANLIVTAPDTLYFFASNAVLWRSTDGGITFAPLDFGFSTLEYCRSEMFFDGPIGFLVIESELSIDVFKSLDYGTSWERKCCFSGEYYRYLLTFTHFYDSEHIEMFSRFLDGEAYKNTVVTNDGFDTYTFNDNNVSFGEYVDATEYKVKFTSESKGCVMAGLNFTKGMTSWQLFLMKDGLNHCVIAHQGIPNCQNNGIFLDCPDLYDLDGVDTTFYIASSNGVIYKSSMASVENVIETAYEVSICPNPTSGQITVMGKSLRSAEVVNMLGQRVAIITGDGDELHIDMASLPNGVYFVEIADVDGKRCVKKVMKE